MENENKAWSTRKIAIVVAVVVILAAVLIGLIVAGMPEKEAAPEEVVYTIPADGNPGDETAKGTYTAADDEVMAANNMVVARLGDFTLTNGQLQVYYWMQVQDFLNNYGAYATAFGLDYTKPLDKQVCAMSENGGTWQQFFLEGALNNWMNFQALSADATAAGFALPEEAQLHLDTMEESLTQDAMLYGMASAEEYIAANMGKGTTLADFAHYMEQRYHSMSYFDRLCEEKAPSDEEVEAYFTEHEADYEASGLTREDKYVSVRHALIMPEGADSSTIRTETFDDAAWAASEARANELLKEFEAGDRSEDSFADLAIQHSQDGSAADGGLFTDVTKGQMVEAFENWCFDDARKSGDYGLVETEFGYHLMYFVSSRPVWVDAVKQEMMYSISNDLVSQIASRYTLDADYANMLIAHVNLGGVEQEEAAGAESLFDKERLPIWIIAGVSAAALAAVAFIFQKKEELI